MKELTRNEQGALTDARLERKTQGGATNPDRVLRMGGLGQRPHSRSIGGCRPITRL